MWEAPQCADSGEPLIERPLQLGRKSEIRNQSELQNLEPGNFHSGIRMLLLTADRFPVITMKYRSPGNASVPVTKRQKRRADKAREGRAPQAYCEVRRGGRPSATPSGRMILTLQ
jgi:hypothetical protein